MTEPHKYAFAANYILDLVGRGIVKPGGRLPSIRKLARQLGVSPITVQHAYELLAAQRAIVSKPRSGYFVEDKSLPKLPSLSYTSERADTVSFTESAYATFLSSDNCGIFCGMTPHSNALGAILFSRELRKTLRRQEANLLSALPAGGYVPLREEIAHHLAVRGVIVRPDEVVITGNGLQGLDLCLDLLTEHGDTVLIDTPTCLPLILSLKRKGLRVLELYSHPVHGVDPDQFAYLLANHRVRAAVLSPICHYPTGVSSPMDVRQKLSNIIDTYALPVIEFDLFSELTYKNPTPWPMMAYGRGTTYYLAGSLLNVVGLEFSLGWIVTRSRPAELAKRRMLSMLTCSDNALQVAANAYFSAGSFEKDLKRVRSNLTECSRIGALRLAEALPPEFYISQPAGGYMSWVRGPSSFDALSFAKAAMARDLYLAPGPMFSPSAGFPNCFGITPAAPWSNASIGALGELLVQNSLYAPKRHNKGN